MNKNETKISGLLHTDRLTGNRE